MMHEAEGREHRFADLCGINYHPAGTRIQDLPKLEVEARMIHWNVLSDDFGDMLKSRADALSPRDGSKYGLLRLDPPFGYNMHKGKFLMYVCSLCLQCFMETILTQHPYADGAQSTPWDEPSCAWTGEDLQHVVRAFANSGIMTPDFTVSCFLPWEVAGEYKKAALALNPAANPQLLVHGYDDEGGFLQGYRLNSAQMDMELIFFVGPEGNKGRWFFDSKGEDAFRRAGKKCARCYPPGIPCYAWRRFALGCLI